MPIYEPSIAPPLGMDANELSKWVYEEFLRLARMLQDPPHDVHVDKLHVAPAKPRDGMVVLADGTNWNPGSGAGFYGYRNGAWQFLG
ncbi:MAG: hypothetical protein ACRD2L_05340 [Terriglobia bacterium]